MTTICTFGRIFIIFLVTLLAACGGEPGKMSTSSSSGSGSSSSSSSGGICRDGSGAVCAVASTDDRCDTDICPSGVYKTFENVCAAQSQAAQTQRNTSCGADEGKPYFSGAAGRACTQEYAPVCAPAFVHKPCTSLPCSTAEYRTFDNICKADGAGVYMYTEGPCGKLEGTAISNLAVACEGIEIDSYCSKTRFLDTCDGQPCFKYMFHNSDYCSVEAKFSSLVNIHECGALNFVKSGPEPSIRLESALPMATHSVSIIRAIISQNVLNVSLSYSGCAPQHFDLFIDQDLPATAPVSTQYVFKTLRGEGCKAKFNSDFAFDLLPLKYAYKKQFGREHGEIILPGLGTYAF